MNLLFAPRAVCRMLAALLLCGVARAVLAAPLADAVERRDVEQMRTLLRSGADANASQADGMTALHWAAHHADPESARLLLQAGASVDAANRYGVTPLALACVNGDSEMANLLLAAGADANSRLPGGETVLMIASRTGRPALVRALLEHGADVNQTEPRGQSALMWAAAEGNVEAVEALLKAGAALGAELDSGFTAFFFAVREGRTGAALRLIAAGASVDRTLKPRRGNERPTNALLLAIENGHFETAAALLEKGADPNAAPAGYSPLHAITWVRKPVRGDGDPAPIGSGSMTSVEMVRRLAVHGADINSRLTHGTSGRAKFTTTGSTAFVLAARTSDAPLLRLLLEIGADPALSNADQSSALLAAAGVGDLGSGDEAPGTEEEALETLRLLFDLGLDVNAVDDNGETAMHGAAYQNWPRVVQLLADRGADVSVWNRKNKAGWTPLQIAQGYRLGNFRPAPDTITAIEQVMRAAGVEPPAAEPFRDARTREKYP